MTSNGTRTPAAAACQILLVLGAAASAAAQCPRLLEPFDILEPVRDLDGWTGFRFYGDATQYSDTLVGGALAGGGDFNGDGMVDAVIGAPHDGALGSYCGLDLRLGNGSAYIVLNRGGSTIGPHPDRSLVDSPEAVAHVLPGSGAGIRRSGYSVAFIGDINGDGFDDVAVGQPEQGWGLYIDPGTGQVFVIFGNSEDLPSQINPDDLDGRNGFRIRGAAIGDSAGWSVSAAGDIDGDGVDDFALGAPNGGDDHSGTVYIIYGRDRMSGSVFPAEIELARFDASHGFRVDGTVRGEGLGRSIANMGDVNGDGRDDLAIGAPQHTTGLGGRTYVLYGREASTKGAFPEVLDADTIAGDVGFRMEVSSARRIHSGWTVAAAGDMNGDGLADMLIGAPYAGEYGIGHAARTYVVFGKRSGGVGFSDVVELEALNGTDGFVINVFGRLERFGLGLAGVDMNGDGLSDVIAGRALLEDPSGTGQLGAVMVLYGRDYRVSQFAPSYSETDIDGVSGVWLVAPKPEDIWGFASVAIAAAGDVNGDGLQDVLVGSPATRDDWSVYCGGVGGATYVVLGRSPRCCADLDYDGRLTISDFIAFQYMFGQQHPFADFDADGSFTIFDFLVFQTSFDAGCP